MSLLYNIRFVSIIKTRKAVIISLIIFNSSRAKAVLTLHPLFYYKMSILCSTILSIVMFTH